MELISKSLTGSQYILHLLVPFFMGRKFHEMEQKTDLAKN